jgi:hypothetical protein
LEIFHRKKNLTNKFNLETHLRKQREFSYKTYGPGKRTPGLIAHIKKELREVAQKPDDLMEWIDIVILACDGALRAGYTPQEIVEALALKQKINEERKWPDWKNFSSTQPFEHDRSDEKKDEEI